MNPRLLIAASAALFGCTACGFKGPLYLAPQHGAVVTHPAPASTTVMPPAQHEPAAKKPGTGSAH